MNQDTPSGRDPEGLPTEKSGDEAPADSRPGPSDTESGYSAAPSTETPEDDAREDPPDTESEPPPRVVEKTVEVRRGGALAFLAFLIALVALGGAGYLWWLQQQPAAADSEAAALAARQAELGNQLSELEGRVGSLE
jgi:hypothetical protein